MGALKHHGCTTHLLQKSLFYKVVGYYLEGTELDNTVHEYNIMNQSGVCRSKRSRGVQLCHCIHPLP